MGKLKVFEGHIYYSSAQIYLFAALDADKAEETLETSSSENMLFLQESSPSFDDCIVYREVPTITIQQKEPINPEFPAQVQLIPPESEPSHPQASEFFCGHAISENGKIDSKPLSYPKNRWELIDGKEV